MTLAQSIQKNYTIVNRRYAIALYDSNGLAVRDLENDCGYCKEYNVKELLNHLGGS